MLKTTLSILIVSLCLITAIFFTPGLSPGAFAVLMLCYILNFRIRTHLKHESGLLLSLLADLSMIILLSRFFLPEAALLVLIPLQDALDISRRPKVAAAVLSLFFLLLLFLNGTAAPQLFTAVYAIALLCLWEIRKQDRRIRELRGLYDSSRHSSLRLEQTQSQLEHYTREVQQLSQIRERNRIAEKLHDTIGHRLTSLLMQLEAGKLRVRSNPSEAEALITGAADSLRGNISLLRDTVSNLEVTSYRDFRTSLQNLIKEFEQNIRIPVSFEIIGAPAEIQPGVEAALYNNVREALTNIARHSKASSAAVTLRYEPHRVILIIADDGHVEQEVRKGFGLRAMQTRTELQNGSMLIETDRGFRLTFEIPLKEVLR